MPGRVFEADAALSGKLDISTLPIEHGVLVGHRNELYLMGGMHWILQFAVGEGVIKAATRDIFWNNIALRRRIAARSGCRYLHLIAPEKYVVLPENMPFPARGHMASFLREQELPDDIVYPVDLLSKVPVGRAYYYTDSHWSVPGRAAIATLIAERAGLSPVLRAGGAAALAAGMSGTPASGFAGDLGRKFTPPVQEQAIVFRRSYDVQTAENGMEHVAGTVFNDGRLIVATSGRAETEKTLLIFGDSYLQLTMEYLAAFFRTIVFCRSRFIHDEIVSLVGPDMIVTENAERYLNAVESDTTAPAFLLLPYLLERKPIFDIAATRAIAALLRSNRGA